MARMTILRVLAVGAVALAFPRAAEALGPEDMRTRTAFIADRYLQIWSSNNLSPVAEVPYMYGRTVTFYGKTYTRADLQADRAVGLTE